MGFLSLYEGTERIEFGHGYWVDVKKCLTHDEKQRVQAKIGAGRQSVDMNGRQFATIDPNGMETEMIVLSIADWNLDDEHGEKFPLKPEPALRAVIARLPSQVTTTIFARCNELNGPRDNKDAATFPDPPGDGGEERDAGPAGTGVVPGEEGVLGPAGGGPGVPGPQAVA